MVFKAKVHPKAVLYKAVLKCCTVCACHYSSIINGGEAEQKKKKKKTHTHSSITFQHSAARWNRTRDAVVAAHWMNDAPSRGRGPLVWCAPAPLSAFCVAAPAAHCVAPRERLLVYSAPSAVVFCVDFALEFTSGLRASRAPARCRSRL